MDELSPLEADIHRRIRAAGPMPVSEYMALCLAHPEHGYYTTRDPFGAPGDFITAPEVSQMFGELIGLWMAAVWKQAGAPKALQIIELGPGRGTLMKDALRALHVMPGFAEAITLHLVEMSPVLRAQQEHNLQQIGPTVSWYETLQEVPQGPSLIIANEFFDALPVHQAIKTGRGWHERCVDLDATGRLAFTAAANPIPHFEALLPAKLRQANEGAIFEWRSDTVIMEIARRVAREGLAALVIDYGHVKSELGDTLQAVRQHAYADPLQMPGHLDLTAHVDFQALAKTGEALGAHAFGPLEQGEFLRRLGIETRAQILKEKASRNAAKDIDASLSRLTGHTHAGMGTLFKAVVFANRTLGAPPAFDE